MTAAPTPRDGERELAAAQLGVVIDWLKEGAGFHVSKAAKHSLGEVLTDMIAAHTSAAVAEAVKQAESERDSLATLVVRLKEAITEMRGEVRALFGDDHDLLALQTSTKALALVPKNLTDCVVISRAEYDKLTGK